MNPQPSSRHRLPACQLSQNLFAGLTRRQFIGTSALGLVALGFSKARAHAAPAPKKISLAEAFDQEMQQFMAARKIPGGALAVVTDRRLVYARAYGWADREKQLPARPDSLFRIASISKPITAVAVFQLVERGKLDLDAPAFDLIDVPPFLPGEKRADERLKQITVRQLLQHTGGWDRDKSYDPMFRSRQIAQALQVPCPPGGRDIIRYMLGQPLDFDPGTRHAYSNFGYCVLGRIIEKITGLPYERYVKQNVLAPIGISRMRLGASRSEQQADGEARYYTSNNATARDVFAADTASLPRASSESPANPDKPAAGNSTSPDSVKMADRNRVPWPYGGFCLEAMHAHGGWIASAVDLARFAAALDKSLKSPLLKPETIRTMYAPPAAPVSRDKDGQLASSFYGCGWMVRPAGYIGKANYWHTGSLPGACTLLVRRWDGVSWAVLFNQRSEDKKSPDSAIDGALHRAADAVAKWPTDDLFFKW